MVNVSGCIPGRRQWWILAALLHCSACGKTPVDAIVFEQDGSDSATGNPCIDGAPSAAPGLFRLRATASGQCLAVGGSTTVGGNPAWSTVMVDDCVVAGEVWELIPDVAGSSVGSFEIRSTTLLMNLDIRMAQTLDGTPAILYEPTSLANQRFYFRPRRAGVFELAPGHVTTRCLSSSPPSPAIARCAPSAADQEWQLIAPDCN